jgi:hypothetical protein
MTTSCDDTPCPEASFAYKCMLILGILYIPACESQKYPLNQSIETHVLNRYGSLASPIPRK